MTCQKSGNRDFFSVEHHEVALIINFITIILIKITSCQLKIILLDKAEGDGSTKAEQVDLEPRWLNFMSSFCREACQN